MATFPNSISLPGNRADLDALIETLIASLDALNDCPDLEDGGDCEPWLGSLERGPEHSQSLSALHPMQPPMPRSSSITPALLTSSSISGRFHPGGQMQRRRMAKAMPSPQRRNGVASQRRLKRSSVLCRSVLCRTPVCCKTF